MEGFLLALPNLTSGGTFLLLALVFRRNKNAANLIAGYNTAPEKEKAKWDAAQMRLYMSNLCFLWTALLLLPGGIVLLIGRLNTAVWALLIGSWGVFLATIVGALLHLNRSARFRA